MLVATVLVGFVKQRPPTQDNIRFREVIVAASTEIEAEIIATQIVGGHDDVEMVISVKIMDVLL